MVGEWPRATIAECAANEHYSTQIGPFGDKIRAEIYKPAGAPILRGTNVNTTERFHDADFVFIDSEVAENEFNKFVCEADDVILCHKGTLGKIGIVPRRSRYTRYIMGNSMMKVRCDNTKLEPLFLYYWLTSQDGQDYLFSRVSQVGVPQIQRPLTTLREATIPLPPIQEQRAIAQILGTLDDKIELNRRMNETLEAMARALFKSWFVDFDPVRAMTEGRDSGLPQPLADLFPDSFEDSELGEIPRGWEVGALDDFLCQRVERCSASPDTAARPYVPIDCISPKSLFLTESKPGGEAQSSLTKFYKGDILFGAMRPYFHKVCIAPFDGTTRTTAFALYPRQADDFAFATLQLHHRETIDFATRHSTGSTIPYAVWTDSLNTMPVIAPPLDVRKAFNRLMQPVLLRIPEPYFENRSLAALRDTLLPKLISGELRVEDPARFLGGGD